MTQEDSCDFEESKLLHFQEGYPEANDGPPPGVSRASPVGYSRFYTALGLLLLLLLTSVFSMSLVRLATHNKVCYEKRYSLDSLWDTVRYQPVQFRLERDIPSPFRGKPRPELDEAWANVTEGSFVLLSPEEMRGLGHSTEGAAKHGDNYLALVEVFHHMHCIDEIRKYIFREHYPYWNSLRGSPEAILGHVDHCIDLLRQKIMCDADIGLMAYSYNATTQFAEARTSNMHMCRDFESIRAWASARRWDPELAQRRT